MPRERLIRHNCVMLICWCRMTTDELERAVETHIASSNANAPGILGVDANRLIVIKYLPASRLDDAIKQQHLYAAERAGFTWGDALYVAPVNFPRTTMMYGEVGVVGTYDTSSARMFDASDPTAISLYQEWITWQTPDYLELTTTVHADLANRTLRNEFRNRFQIDCILFRPDEHCLDYVDSTSDWWLAITHWDATRRVGSGFSKVITGLKWCVIRPESFSPRKDGMGFDAHLHKRLSASHAFASGHFSNLSNDIRIAYGSAANQVIVCDFN